MTDYMSPQENFWAGKFGTEYSTRVVGDEIVSAYTAMHAKILQCTSGVETILEFGANIGLNLEAYRRLLPKAELSAIEINPVAIKTLEANSEIYKVYGQSMMDFKTDYQRDLVLIKTVLIHINPDLLPAVYRRLYEASKRYICLVEYYNPSPVVVEYRGHQDRLFKRDFAGEIMDKYPDLKLVDYGFCYHRDPTFPMDDLNWFLLEKTGR